MSEKESVISYKPVPKAYDKAKVEDLVDEALKDWEGHWAAEVLYTVVGNACLQLMKQSVGLFPVIEKDTYWSRPHFKGAMAEDPYLVYGYKVSSYSMDAKYERYMKAWGVHMRDAGAWTLHADSGRTVGVFASHFNVRINPSSLKELVSTFPPHDGSKEFLKQNPVGGASGWRYLRLSSDSISSAQQAIYLWGLWEEGHLLVQAKGEVLIMRDVRETFRPHQVFMESFLQDHTLEVSTSSGDDAEADKDFYKGLFKSVPFPVIENKLYERSTLEKFLKDLAKAKDGYLDALRKYREQRDILRAFERVGSIEDVLDCMGRDLEDGLRHQVLSWLPIEENWRRKHTKFCKTLAEEMLAGTLSLSAEMPAEITEALEG